MAFQKNPLTDGQKKKLAVYSNDLETRIGNEFDIKLSSPTGMKVTVHRVTKTTSTAGEINHNLGLNYSNLQKYHIIATLESVAGDEVRLYSLTQPQILASNSNVYIRVNNLGAWLNGKEVTIKFLVFETL